MATISANTTVDEETGEHPSETLVQFIRRTAREEIAAVAAEEMERLKHDAAYHLPDGTVRYPFRQPSPEH